MTKIAPKVGLMMDTETLALESDAIVWQLALTGFPMDDPSERLGTSVNHFLPVQPQLDSLTPSRFTFKTLLFTLKSPTAIANLALCDSEDPSELVALMKHFIRSFERMTTDPVTGKKLAYELICRRPQFDVPIVERLLKICGLKTPWSYDTVIDLATLMDYAGVSPSDVEVPEGYIKHDAYWDNEHQIRCYAEAIKHLRSRS